MGTDPETYFAQVQLMLGHIGDIEIDGSGFESIMRLNVHDEDGPRTFTFAQDPGGRRNAPQLLTGQDLDEASLAMFSIHIEEAIATAEDRTNTLKLIPSGVVAVEN